jgi:hypothetical protein
MKRIAIVLITWFAVAPPLHPQDGRQGQREACMDACMRERPDADLQRQEVIALEKETARAIQLGVLSRGQNVDKSSFIAVVQAPQIKYESFAASDIKVRLYRDVAVATSTWSMRVVLKGQRMSSQMRVLHVYLYGAGGYHVVAAQTTSLPPYLEQPL